MKLFFLCSLMLAASWTAHAETLPHLKTPSSVLIAQDEGDDSYDPFADYSEFEEASDEEEDINFFKNGRFFTMGFVGGMRSFMGQKKNVYGSGPTYGLFLSYFFDLRFALQFGFGTGDHDFHVRSATQELTGNASFTYTSFALKYYFNTQNVTRGLADLNPYVLGGFSQYYRTITVDGYDSFSKDPAVGFDFGGGIEIPMMRKKMYFGIQATYHHVTFKDDSKEIILDDSSPTGVKPQGDIYDLLGILGVNF